MKKNKLAILTNQIVPSRIPIYNYLGCFFDVKVFYSRLESNRNYFKSSQSDLRDFRSKKSFGFVFKYAITRKGQKFKLNYLHINPGYLFDLMIYRPDFIISNEMGFRSLSALLYCLATRKPLWIWWGGTVYTERNVSPLKKILRNFFKEYPKWISYGKTSTDYLLSIGIKRSRILQVQNTINEQLFFNNKSFVWLNYPAPKILFVGELVQRKGLDLLLNSISRLRKNGYQFSLIIIGEGPEKSRYQSIVANHQLKQVYFLGSIPSHKVPKYYNAVDFMVFPTLHDVWGLVVNEALWSNLPVLSSKYAGASEELLEPTYIFDPLDAKDFDIKMQMMHNTYKEFTTDFDKLINIEDVGKMIASELKSD